MNPFDYTIADSGFETRLIATTSHWSHYAVTFPAAHQTRYEESNTVFGDYFMPHNMECSPLVILLHGFGDKSLIPCGMLARHLAKQGIATFVLYLIFHSSRMPKAMRGQFLPPTVQGWLEAFRVSVIDVRTVIDWAAGKDEIDEQRIGTVGISLGGMISAIAMGTDERIVAGIFVVTGGNLEELSWGGRSSIARRGHSCTRAECHSVYSRYPKYLNEVAQKGLENVSPVKECFLFDPITFAAHLRGRPILMINALWDEIIPKRSTLDFWEACGRPQLIWLPATHLSIYLWYPIIRRKVSAFFKSSLVCESARPQQGD